MKGTLVKLTVASAGRRGLQLFPERQRRNAGDGRRARGVCHDPVYDSRGRGSALVAHPALP